MSVSGRELFYKRFIEEWKYQWGIIKSVLDWTIVLYMVIPGVVIGASMYREAWQSIELYWSSIIPFPLLLAVLLLLAVGGHFRTYLLKADLLYLLQRKAILHELKRCGLLSSLLLAAIGNGAIFVLILPILVGNYQLTGMEILLLYIAAFAARMLFMTLNKLIARPLYKWLIYPFLYIAVLILLAAVNPVIYGTAGGLVILLLILFQMAQITKTNRWFQREIEIEDTERTRYVKLILNFSREVEKEKVSTAKRPWFLFSASQRLFNKRNKENGLLEMLLKSFLRNPAYLKSYYQMTAVTLAAIVILPLWLKWLVCFSFVAFAYSWARSIFNKMKASPFFAVVPFEKDLHYEVLPRFQRWIALPAVTLAGLLTILLTIF